MTKPEGIDTNGFIAGIGYVVARLVEDFDQISMASNIIGESGYAYIDFHQVCAEEDLPAIKKAWEY
jgi:hypothetical protein